MTKNNHIKYIGIATASLAFLSFFMVINYAPSSTKKVLTHVPSERKKVLIFTSSGGRGHTSATEAIQEYLGNSYEVKPVYVLREVLQEIDFIHKITGGYYYSEEMYNHFLTRKQVGCVKTMVYAGHIFLNLRRRAIEQMLDAYITQEDPDMIISVMPTINGMTAAVTHRHGIPFWVIPTDFDASGFLFQLYKPKSDQFFINCPLEDRLVKRSFRPAALTLPQFTYIGMPVREQFLRTYNKKALKAKYKIPANKPVIMVMMGGRGAQGIKKLAAQLVKLTTPVHLLLCVGKHIGVKPAIEKLRQAPGVTLSVIEFVSHIAELMAVSDLFITKAGGQSVSEALYMGLPMIIDATDQGIDWELLNRRIVEKYDVGVTIQRLQKLVPMVQEIIDDPEQLAEWKRNIQDLGMPNPREGVRTMVASLIGT